MVQIPTRLHEEQLCQVKLLYPVELQNKYSL
jgi:hypothetical protein